MLRACRALLESIEKQSPVPAFSDDFSTCKVSLELDELFNCHGVHGMLTGGDY